MLDLVVRNGEIIDGTGQRRYRGDLGVRGGRVVAVGACDEPARREIDATDLIVAPGFIDIHTHFDSQVFWDPTLGPSPTAGASRAIQDDSSVGRVG